jgi:UDP-perosamine 4-acetyltransferase
MRLIVIGARHDGLAHLVMDSIEARGEHAIVAFADETQELWGTNVFGKPVIGPPSKIPEFLEELDIKGAVIAIGNGQARDRFARGCRDMGLDLPSIIHPSSHVSGYATIGEGVFLGQGVQVLAGATIGDFALINAGTVVSHHVHIGRATTIGPNSTLAGRSRIGHFVFLGAASTVLPDVTVGENAILGAGGVLVSDLPKGVTAAGVPAKPIKNLRRPLPTETL